MRKTNYTNEINVDYVNPFFLYVFKITHKRNGSIEYNYKIGKANEPFKRIEEWKKEISAKLVDVEVEYVWTQECVHNVGDYTYYMTKNERLTGNDADDIFRTIAKTHFGVDIYTLQTDNGDTITDECGDFKTTDNDVVVDKLKQIFEKWKSLVDEYIANGDVDKCDIFVRYCHTDSKKEKKEFLEDRYEYQRESSDWIVNQLMAGNNEDSFLKVDCGGGKTSIVLDASTRVSSHDNEYNPILVLSGLNSVYGAFESDALKYTYHGHEVKVYSIYKFDKSTLERNKKNHIISLVCATVQSSVKSDKCDDVVDESSFAKNAAKLSSALEAILKSGVRFSCGITDEAHKIVFGEKMHKVFELIRSYHTKLNFIHMSGTGFSIQNNPLLNNKYEIDPADIRKEQGAAAVNRHIIVNRNPMFLPYFYSNIEKGWDMLLNDKCNIDSGVEDVDSINCISTIKSGLVKPVIVSYLQNVYYVEKSFDYLIKKFSFEEALIISANGGGGIKGDKFVRNDVNGKVCKITDKNAHSEITTQIRKAVAKNKMVILLNVNKFVESWTIKEMNVELILRNMSSPDMFGQTICRPTRVYKHLDHVIKKDAFIFLYGDTFVTMAYEYNNLLKQNSSKKTTNPIKFMNDEDTVYMDGNVFNYKSGNLNDLDKIIRSEVMRLNRSADGFSSLLMKKYPNAFKEIMERGERFFKDTATYGGRATINVVETPDTPNGERPDISDAPTDTPNGKKSDASDTPIEKNKNEEKKQLAQIKTFITNLQIEGVTSYFKDGLKYDNLVNSMKENAAKGNKVTECERMLSECFGDNYEEFKRDVESWLENWIETIN
jgi:hypothetical protein